MRHRGLPAIVVALLLGLILGGGAIAALNIPKHSIGWNKLSPGLQAKLRQLPAPGPRGPVGPEGPAGAVGPPGQAGPENVLGYSARLLAGDPDRSLAQVGPLSFTASCAAEGEDTTKAVLSATSSADGVRLNGTVLNAGETTEVQKLSWSGGGSREEFLPIIRATDSAPSFALEGVPVVIVDV